MFSRNVRFNRISSNPIIIRLILCESEVFKLCMVVNCCKKEVGLVAPANYSVRVTKQIICSCQRREKCRRNRKAVYYLNKQVV